MRLDSEEQRQLLINLLSSIQLNISPVALAKIHKGEKNEIIELIEAIEKAPLEEKNRKNNS